ncbi:GNAT family N-acetyltransferase [Aquimarina sp. I32.4]|uniref:GNAT family N-acetyltransferase n=1 Tax=Aquimarina sp. I32.4 TaxID=2053903 RepID=UPI000CDE9ECC|nr:GNAT family N-acetyltransferase [Aquimarina sp. I32.4]
MQNKILETERLILREFDLSDYQFILELVNTPLWLKYIGDKNVKTDEDAKAYIKNTLLKSYRENGYGLWMVQSKQDYSPIGMCGLINRDSLEHVDIGFAMLPDYMKQGYGFEIANATINYTKHVIGLDKIIGITDVNNIASIKLLNKLGLLVDKTLQLSEYSSVLVFSPQEKNKDKNEIDKLTHSFFDIFTNTNGRKPDVSNIVSLFIEKGTIINTTTAVPEIYTIQEFIMPREKILNDGTLTDFIENEITHETAIYSNIAQRFCLYKKSGKLKGVDFESKGMKSIQFIKTNEEWKISSVIWSDEQ